MRTKQNRTSRSTRLEPAASDQPLDYLARGSLGRPETHFRRERARLAVLLVLAVGCTACGLWGWLTTSSRPSPVSFRSPPRVERTASPQQETQPTDGWDSHLESRVPANLVLLVDSLLKSRQYLQAEAALRELWRAYPATAAVAGRLAVVLQVNHDESGLDEAGELLKTALEQHSDRGDLRLALARVLIRQNRSLGARQLLAATPANSTYRQEIETLRVTLGDPYGAVDKTLTAGPAQAR